MPVIVQTVTSKVSALWGKSFIRDANGKFRPLEMHDTVVRGDVILTEQNAIVQLTQDLAADAGPAAPRVALAPTAMDRAISGLNNSELDFVTAAGTRAGDGGLTPATRVERLIELAPGGSPPANLEGFKTAFAVSSPPANPAVALGQPSPARLNVGVDRLEGAEVIEGAALVFPVTLSGTTDAPLTLPFSLVQDSINQADIGEPIFSNAVVLNADGSITVPAGVDSFVITVPTVNDNLVEGPERLTLNVGGSSVTGLINDDDVPRISSVEPGQPGVGDDAVPEGNDLVYTVTLSATAANATVFPFAMGGGSAGGADYRAPQFSAGVVLNTDGSLTVPAGVSSFMVTVPTVDDSLVEALEALPLSVGGVTGTGGIIDNDQPTVIKVEPGKPGATDDSTPEGSNLEYTVTLSSPTTASSNYPFSLGGGTAGAGDIGPPT